MHKLKIAIININTFVNLDSKLFEKIKSNSQPVRYESCACNAKNYGQCVFPENIQTPTVEGISRCNPSTPLNFPFPQDKVQPLTPSNLWQSFLLH